MYSKQCVLITHKIEKYNLIHVDLQIFFANVCCLSCTKCYVHIILSVDLFFPEKNIKECALFFISIV